MNLRSFIDELISLDINIDVDGSELKIYSSKTSIPEAIINRIRDNKHLLIDHLLSKKTSHLFSNIPVVKVQPHYVLSSSQLRLWAVSQFEDANAAYNMPGVYVFEGDLNFEALETAFNNLIERHEILRTVFKETESGEVRQFINTVAECGFSMVKEDWTDREDETKLRKQINKWILQSFNLSTGPLLRVKLYQQTTLKWIFACTMHHIISDGASMEVFISELFYLYKSSLLEEKHSLTPLQIQYKDYAHWQQAQLKSDSFEHHKRYWMGQLDGELPELGLSTDKPRPAIKTYHGDIASIKLFKDTVQRFKLVSQKQGTTLFMGLLAAVKTLLHRYSGDEDIIVGSPVAGREHNNLSNQIGSYFNTIALRTRFNGEDSFNELLINVKNVTLGAYEHQAYPFDEVIEFLRLERNMNRHPLFDILVTYRDAGLIESSVSNFESFQIKSYECLSQETSAFDITFSFVENEEGIQLDLVYNRDIYHHSTMERMASHFVGLIEAIVADPSRKLGQLVFLTETEKHQLLISFNETQVDYPQNKTIIDLFEEQVKAVPDRVAVEFRDIRLTYHELNEQANRLGDYLRKKYGLRPNDLVGIKLERSEWMVIVILGILKSGAAYMPIDPEYPQDRIHFLISDSNCKLVIDKDELKSFKTDRHVYEKGKLATAHASSDLAYLIYTSGSTGLPKGVLITHKNLNHFLMHIIHQYADSDNIVQPFVASYAFDISLFQLLTPLICGGLTKVISKEMLQDMDLFITTLKEVTYVDTVPAVYQMLVNHIEERNLSAFFNHIQRIFIGGDKIPDGLLQKLSKIFSNAKIIVTYGPTEGTIFCTHLVYEPKTIDQKVTGANIGSPINNTSIYILDKQQALVPIGAIGEICIGGDGVAKGYFNQEKLTAEKFISNPFSIRETIYRTGDLGKWGSDGRIEFVGRMDSQVKIRGYRIETDEINKSIEVHEDVKSSYTIAAKLNLEESTLVSFFVKKVQIQVWPSISEYLGYNELAYFAMNADERRANAYKNAIYQSVNGKVVVDVGTGPEAILAQHCIAAGAKKVYAIEILDDIYEKAKIKIESLGLSDRIILIHGNVMDIELPELVDYCVCALVGNMGSSDGCIPIMNSAKRFLKDHSCMIPYQSITRIAAISLPFEEVNYKFTDSGADYVSSIFDSSGEKFDLRMGLQHISENHLISTKDIFEDLDLRSYLPLNNEREIELIITSDSLMSGFLIWLNLYTTPDLLNDIFLSQKSFLPIYFPVFEIGIQVRKGDVIKATVGVETPDNTIYPDYWIKGTVFRNEGNEVPFAYVSKRFPGTFCKGNFYQRIFPDGQFLTKPVLSAQRLREYLQDKLPEYMVPAFLIEIKELPLNTNGKVDRKSLLAAANLEHEHHAVYVEAGNEIEERLVKFWCALLGKEKIGIHDNFFSLGGHSLKAIRLMTWIHKDFNVKLEVKEIFTHATIHRQAKLITLSQQLKFESIPVAPVQSSYPLSSSQMRLWVLSQLKAGNVAYNMPGVYVFEDKLDFNAFANSFYALIERHEILRTTFKEDENGEIRQFINASEDLAITLEYEDLDGSSYFSPAVSKNVKAFFNHSFDFIKGPLLRAKVYRQENHKWFFVYNMHHIISDGWSMEILINELLNLYRSHLQNEISSLIPLRIQYKDYAVWQQHKLHSASFSIHKSYWLKQFEGELPQLEFPLDMPRPAVKTYRGSTVNKEINSKVSGAFRQLVHNNGSTLFMGLFGAVNLLLYRYTGQEDIIIGTPIAGREHSDLSNQIGFYVNTLALRTCFNGDYSFEKLLTTIKETTLTAYKHQVYPFDELIESLNLQRSMNRHPLFDVMVTIQSTGSGVVPRLVTSEAFVNAYESTTHEISKFDFTFNFLDTGSEIILGLEYNKDIYYADTINRLTDHLEQLIEAIVKHPALSINKLNYLREPEEQQLLQIFNDTSKTYPKEKTVIDLFEEQVVKTPDQTAVVFEDRSLTYKELNERANQLGNYLRKTYKLKPDDLVSIQLDRSEWMIISILGVLKAGAAYLPIDPEYPKDRIEYMLTDSNSKALIDNQSLEKIKITLQQYDTNNLKSKIQSHNLIYVMYTSGSMGQPKGVLIEHSSVVRLVRSTNYVHFSSHDVLLSTGSISFDATTFEYWGMLLNGGKLVLCRQEELMDAEQLKRIIQQNEVNIMWFTSSWFNQLVDTDMCLFEPLTRALVGGDKLSNQHIYKLQRSYPSLQIINGYGPTENTTFSATFTIDDEHPTIPIGKPISNSTVYIMDGAGKLCPIGGVGEICVGGDGLARGYLNNAALTNEKFVRNPYEPGKRIYKTGDLGRWLSDGNIAFMGRKDAQVKIRGYRIELGEIEHALLCYEAITSGVVVMKENAGEKYLIAYAVSKESLNVSALREHLSKQLPSYMLPAYYVQLESLPLTSNGKIDYKSLPVPDGMDGLCGIEFIAPETDVEIKLAEIWEEILGEKNIGLKDDFFIRGGHSLKVSRLLSAIHKKFGAKLSMLDIFTFPILETQVKLINEAERILHQEIKPASTRPGYPLSSSQQRLWILSQFEGGNIAYNISGVYVREEELNYDALRFAFSTLLERHEILRTVFRIEENGEIRQVVKSPQDTGFEILIHDLRTEDNKQLEEFIQTEFRRPFDLTTGPLVYLNVYQVEDEKWVITHVMHHIISDGWSMDILIKELMLLYNAHVQKKEYPLSPLRIQYKDYAVWQQEQLTGNLLESHKRYWLKQFEGDLPLLDLRGDRPRPRIKTYNGAQVAKNFKSELTAGFKFLRNKTGATSFMNVLSLVNVLLYKYTNQDDIIIGSPVANRDHIDFHDQIGFYSNTIALRTQFKGDYTFMELLSVVKRLVIDAYEHNMYPFDSLIEDIKINRDLSRNPLFDVQVIWSNQYSEEEYKLKNDEISTYAGISNEVSRFDLVFIFLETNEGLELNIEYNRDIYNKGTVEQLANHLEQLLEVIIEQPDSKLEELIFLNKEEKEQLLLTFNDTATFYPKNKTVIDLFEEQAKKSPDAIAVIFESIKLSYRELNEKANQLCDYLMNSHGIKPEEKIGMMLDKSELAIVAMLGILKAGGVYVPIDLSLPKNRKEFIIADTQVRLLITKSDFIYELEKYEGSMFAIDLQLDFLDTPVSVSSKHLEPDHLAYVIYTSGSTGEPKGVLVEHQGLVNMANDHIRKLQLAITDHVLQFMPLSSDGSILDVLMTLLAGATLVLVNKHVISDLEGFVNYLDENRVSIVTLPPSYLHLLNRNPLKTVRTIITAAETAIVDDAKHYSKYKSFYNGYGPSESTVNSALYKVDPKGCYYTIPIGSPADNKQIYILNEHLHLLPIGVVGEIYIAGAGLARGYLNHPELTAQQFIPDPFRPGEKMYKSGDLGRWLANGIIEFIGRADDQIKISGYRIELGEIENALSCYPGIESSAVLVKQNSLDEKELVAYMLSKEILNVSEIANYLGKLLPSYMLPGRYIKLPEMPLTPNGKIDRKQLPGLDDDRFLIGIEYIAPRNSTEETLVKIWEDVLSEQLIGIRDDFFIRGGQSLKAIRLLASIHKEFNIKLNITTIFDFPTIEEQARIIEETEVTLHHVIPVASIQSDYPLSSSQQRLWILSQFEETNIAYNITDVCVLKGTLDKAALSRSFDALLDRHEILRTIFKKDKEDKPRQFIRTKEAVGFKLKFEDWRNIANAASLIRLQLESVYNQPFNLNKGPLLRAGLYRVEDEKWIFVYSMHHIISDGWSMEVLIKELMQLYHHYLLGETSCLVPLRIQYKDYAVWQKENFTKDVFTKHKNYWLKQFAGELPVLEFPSDRMRPKIKTYQGGRINKKLDSTVSVLFSKMVQDNNATLFMGLLGVVNVLLHRYTNQEDIIIGSPIAAREHSDLSDQIGFYVNTLALRTSFKGVDSFKDLLENIKKVTLSAYEHQVYPFDELVESLNLPRNMNRHPLFDILITLKNFDSTPNGLIFKNLDVSPYEEEFHVISKFDFMFSFIDTGSELVLGLEYNSDIYYQHTVELLADHLEQLITAIAENPLLEIQKLDYLKESEKQQLLMDFNKTPVSHSQSETVIDLFEKQALQNPDNKAILFEDISLTYNELNESANQLGNYLRDKYNIGPDDLIGLKLERSEWMVIAMLGILKSGAAYVPIDPDYPQDRIDYIISDSRCKVLIDEHELNVFKNSSNQYFKMNLTTKARPSDLSYVIYTSGSTGKPKGVLIEHRNMYAFINWCEKEFVNSNFDVVFSVTSVCFDLSIFEIFYTLSAGKKVRLLKNAMFIIPYLKTTEAILLNTVPSVIAMLLKENADFSQVKILNMAGEPIQKSIIRSLDCAKIEIRNLYGPSETTTYSSVFRIHNDKPILIGHPIANTDFFILNDSLQLQPVGVIGEICIGGSGVARGYLNRPELMAEKFVINPFKKDQRIYRTGDLGRWLPDGNMELIGRKDDQVKLRGYRIELGEIESVLSACPEIESSVVVVKENASGEKDLVAYLVSKNELNSLDIREQLSKTLPAYLIPTHFVQLEKLPLNPNRKIDRKNLPEYLVNGISSGVAFVAARNETEAELIRIWEGILGKETIGIKDDFFINGGNSLKAILLLSTIHKKTGKKLNMSDVFITTKLEEQAQLIDEKHQSNYKEIPIVTFQPSYPLSSSQRRLWILSQLEGSSAAYNMPGIYLFEGQLDQSALMHSFYTLIDRHEILRTTFEEDETGSVRQFIKTREEIGMQFQYEDLQMLSNHDAVVRNKVTDFFNEPFNLSKGPLIRMKLFHENSNRWIFTYVMHHIISDGWSMEVLINELLTLYNAFREGFENPLLPLRIQYKDYAAWQQEQLKENSLQDHKDYWLKQFEGVLPVLELPTDRDRPKIKTYNGGIINKSIDHNIAQGIRTLIRNEESTAFMGLLTAVNILLYKHTYQNDIIIGSPMAGRAHADLENQIGFYLNILPIRTCFSEKESYTQLLKKVKQQVLNAFEHHVYPFDELVNELNLQRDTSRESLFDVMIVFQNADTNYKVELGSIGELKVHVYEMADFMDERTSKYDLGFYFSEVANELQLSIRFNSDLFNRSTIKEMSNQFEKLLVSIIKEPLIPIKKLECLNLKEEKLSKTITESDFNFSISDEF